MSEPDYNTVPVLPDPPTPVERSVLTAEEMDAACKRAIEDKANRLMHDRMRLRHWLMGLTGALRARRMSPRQTEPRTRSETPNA